ncbi:hypothetical protein [Marichromatium purpuratum]|uniref:hypothetical protein n=1 Tax=Marichromatium purpuratum TaxID=37487 RepID=UPI0002F94C7E|nr:hypothetical protein [Marichromatium purpuratum]
MIANPTMGTLRFAHRAMMTPGVRGDGEEKRPLAAGGWRLAAGGWRLAAGGWRLKAEG